MKDFTRDTSNCQAYEADLKTQSATEKQLAIIGKTLNKFVNVNQELSAKTTNQ